MLIGVEALHILLWAKGSGKFPNPEVGCSMYLSCGDLETEDLSEMMPRVREEDLFFELSCNERLR